MGMPVRLRSNATCAKYTMSTVESIRAVWQDPVLTWFRPKPAP